VFKILKDLYVLITWNSFSCQVPVLVYVVIHPNYASHRLG